MTVIEDIKRLPKILFVDFPNQAISNWPITIVAMLIASCVADDVVSFYRRSLLTVWLWAKEVVSDF